MKRRQFTKGFLAGSAGLTSIAATTNSATAKQAQRDAGVSEFRIPNGVETGGSSIPKVSDGHSINYHEFHGSAIAREGDGGTKAVVGETGKGMDLYTSGKVIRSKTLRAGAGWQYFDVGDNVDEIELTIDYNLDVEASGWKLWPYSDGDEYRDTHNTEKQDVENHSTFVNEEEYESNGIPLIIPIGTGAIGAAGLMVALTNSGGSYSVAYAIDRIDESTTDPQARIIDHGDLYGFNDSGDFSHENTYNYSDTITVENVDPDYTYRLVLMGGCAISATGLAKATVDMKSHVGGWGLQFPNIEIAGK